MHPSLWMGTTIMLLAVLSAGVHYFVLQRIKAGNKAIWQIGGLIALALGLAAVAMQIYQLGPCRSRRAAPGTRASSSASTRFSWSSSSAVLIWLEILLARSRYIPALSFVEQPPTYTDTYVVQRFQASLSAFSAVWSYLAVMALLFWLLFYAL